MAAEFDHAAQHARHRVSRHGPVSTAFSRGRARLGRGCSEGLGQRQRGSAAGRGRDLRDPRGSLLQSESISPGHVEAHGRRRHPGRDADMGDLRRRPGAGRRRRRGAIRSQEGPARMDQLGGRGGTRPAYREDAREGAGGVRGAAGEAQRPPRSRYRGRYLPLGEGRERQAQTGEAAGAGGAPRPCWGRAGWQGSGPSVHSR